MHGHCGLHIKQEVPHSPTSKRSTSKAQTQYQEFSKNNGIYRVPAGSQRRSDKSSKLRIGVVFVRTKIKENLVCDKLCQDVFSESIKISLSCFLEDVDRPRKSKKNS